VSFDRNLDAVPAADPPLRRPGDFNHAKETAEGTEADADSSLRDRVITGLVAENADLYRRNTARAKLIHQLQTRLDRSEARFHAWADEMAVRDEARAKREEALTERVAELEHQRADRPAANDPLGAQRRLDKPDSARAENDQHERKRAMPSNEFIGIGIAAGVEAVTAVGDPTPSNLLIGALGMVATGVPWIRKIREAGHGDRPRE
jgi:hypothetical protein